MAEESSRSRLTGLQVLALLDEEEDGMEDTFSCKDPWKGTRTITTFLEHSFRLRPILHRLSGQEKAPAGENMWCTEFVRELPF